MDKCLSQNRTKKLDNDDGYDDDHDDDVDSGSNKVSDGKVR
jgi:hypothetical protein